jgi:hypothetical protein
MLTKNKNRRVGDAAARQVIRDWRDGPTRNSQTALTPGLTARGAAPVLALCRSLIVSGHDSTNPLEARRGKTLCLRVSSIGQGARLTVRVAGNGCPVFERECADGAGASLTRKTGSGPYQPTRGQQLATVVR